MDSLLNCRQFKKLDSCILWLKPATHSGESCRPFRLKPATDSGRKLPPIPDETCHLDTSDQRPGRPIFFLNISSELVLFLLKTKNERMLFNIESRLSLASW